MQQVLGRHPAAVLCAVVVVAFFSVGCVNTPPGIPIVDGRELDDIRFKSCFEFVGSESYEPPVTAAGKFRSWKGIYRGPGLAQEIGPWYVGAMKQHGWKFTDSVESGGSAYTCTYRFVKDDEEAVIHVYREYSLAGGKSVNMVRAEVHPRGIESFLPEHIETLKTTGDSWTTP